MSVPGEMFRRHSVRVTWWVRRHFNDADARTASVPE